MKNKSFPIFALKGYKLPNITEKSDNTKINKFSKLLPLPQYLLYSI